MCRNHKHSYIPITDLKSQIKNELPFTIATKRIKYLGIQLTGFKGPLQGELQTTAQQNREDLREEIREEIRDGKKFHAHG